ncbi:hypothetical protein EBE87_24025 [Pseudoroseomonas wenyumeiae]|uniref:Transposase IS4-like domain-containing protein n=1 Tax=Teichococcus wenyumeiae TaxID=2478470 RepID=A0A3A9JJJ5_9PROT|nr:hypothetical protein D6Z83_12420 [Pseudoroseomonas wenyumeiae]RMI17104.1 hypothetical protein EBE87_24025 [Pseudoroseomonas wenyumeiae]
MDAAKRLERRKRHVAVNGRLLMVNLTAADVQDASGAEQIVKAIRKRWPWLKHLFADGAYDRGKLMSAAAYHDSIIEVVRKLGDQQGFQVLPRRCDVSEAMIHVSMRALLIRRIAHL